MMVSMEPPNRESGHIYPITRNPADTGLGEREIEALTAENTGTPDARISAIGRRADDIDPGKLQREYPRWNLWVGIAGLRYARRNLTSPPAIVRGEDWTDLRDQIRGWEGTHTQH